MDNEKTKKKSNKIWIIVLIVFLILFLISAGFIISKFIPEKNTAPEKYKTESGADTSSTNEILVDNPMDFEKIKKDNPDVIGWIKVEDTVIDYPVLMSGMDKKENFYLDHDINLNSKKAGSLYVQRMNSYDFSDFNTVVYGHNMLNGTMFGQLKKFRNKQYFNEHRTMYVYCPGHILQYEIVEAFVFDDRHLLNSFNIYTDEGKLQFIDTCKNSNSLGTKNLVDGFDIKTTDRLVTLSTCTSVDNQRFLVMGKLIKDTKTK